MQNKPRFWRGLFLTRRSEFLDQNYLQCSLSWWSLQCSSAKDIFENNVIITSASSAIFFIVISCMDFKLKVFTTCAEHLC